MTDAATPRYTNRQFIIDIWRFIRPYRGRFLLATFFRLASDIAILYPAYALASLITFLSTWQAGETLTPAWTILVLWLIAALIYSFGHWGGKHLGYLLSERSGADAFAAGLEQLTALDTHWHERESSGIKLKRIQRGRDAINKAIRGWFTNIIQITVDFAGTLFVLAHTDLLTGAIFLVFIISFSSIALAFTKKATDAAHVEGFQEEKVQGSAFEIISNVRTVRALNIRQYLSAILHENLEELYTRISRRIFWFRTQSLALVTWQMLFKLSVFAFIIYGISQGRFEIGFLILFNEYHNRVRSSSLELAEVSQDFIVAKNNFWRLQETLSLPRRTGITAPQEFPTDWKTISFQNTSFSYDPVQPVLQDLTFTINKGERIGVVGSSGAGKSTIFKLLLKEYDTFSGSITINATPIQAINEDSYFKRVAVVLQDTEVFNLTLRENITTANPDMRDDAALFARAVTVSHVSDFVHKLPQGYDTIIGEKGFKLSGGERQRLGIARAIFKNPDLLLLDEATSHLDLESEEKIRDSLHQFFKHVTAVVIAHRLTTIKEMDRIIVLEQGRIIETGTFDELYAAKGRFFDLWEKQKL